MFQRTTNLVLLGIVLELGAGLIGTGNFVLNKEMLKMGMPFWRTNFVATGLAFPMVLIPTLLSLGRDKLPTMGDVLRMMAANVILNLCWAFGMLAVQLGASPGDVCALGSINMVVAGLGGYVFLGQPVSRVQAAALALTIMGAVLISKPSFIFGASTMPLSALLACLTSGFMDGSFCIIAQLLKAVPVGIVTAGGLLTLSTVCLLFPFTPFVEDGDVSRWLESPLLSLMFMGILMSMTVSLMAEGRYICKLLPAILVCTLGTAIQLGFGYLAGAIFWGIPPDWASILGATVMLIAVTLMALFPPEEEADESQKLAKVIGEQEEEQDATGEAHDPDQAEASGEVGGGEGGKVGQGQEEGPQEDTAGRSRVFTNVTLPNISSLWSLLSTETAREMKSTATKRSVVSAGQRGRMMIVTMMDEEEDSANVAAPKKEWRSSETE